VKDNHIDLVLFGAAGDLSRRKLLPALMHLDYSELLSPDLRILALSREDISTDQFMAGQEQTLKAYLGEQRWSEGLWQRFCQRVDYVSVQFTDISQYAALSQQLKPERVAVFYFATPPSLFQTICENLNGSGCLSERSRVVLEKPIGRNHANCKEVNETVGHFFDENRIYRIDHYLGKETVQNLLALRFANRFINAQWDNTCIDHVQITVAETVGIDGRFSYYDQVGQLRDMLQNHLMQLLCLVAMEPPNTMTAHDIRDEKVKVVRALRVIDDATVADHVVRGQYTQGWYRAEELTGYLDLEDADNPDSDTETFVAVKAFIDNWRWAGVPFYLRTGKRMGEKVTEIVITYKTLAHNIFASHENSPNRLVIRLQPNEGIEMQMLSKQHGIEGDMGLIRQNLDLNFLAASGIERIPDAYERLFLDVIRGDQSLFVGREEVEQSWLWCDQLISAWESRRLKVNPYSAGTKGPAQAELLIGRDGRSWHE
jgi:glucose-6-phosphate 1-dehydrogenase